jgi:hypothetical protein
MTIVAVARAVRRRSPAAESAAPTSEWQRLSTTSGFEERTTYQASRARANGTIVHTVLRYAIVWASLLVACRSDHTRREREESVPLVAGSTRSDTADALGQWIWSRTDSSTFVQARDRFPALVPTVWIGTISSSKDGRIRSQLALSPRVAGARSAGVVIRFENSFTTAWAASDSAVANAVLLSVRSFVAAAVASGVEIVELQLDYDCPERLLSRWAVVVGRLSRDPTLGLPVWITSLVTHVRHPRYGDLFRTAAQGHIVQVFDTGDRMSPSYARTIERLATSHRVPFRLGVAAFERDLASGRTTEHRSWFAAAPVLAESEWYRGLWVFPGGRSWAELLSR